MKPNKSRCCGQLFCYQHLSDVSRRVLLTRTSLRHDGSGYPRLVQTGAVRRAGCHYQSKRIQFPSTLQRNPSYLLVSRRRLQVGNPAVHGPAGYLFHATLNRVRVQVQIQTRTGVRRRLRRARMALHQSTLVDHPFNRSTRPCLI